MNNLLTTNIMFSLVFIVCSCNQDHSDTKADLEKDAPNSFYRFFVNTFYHNNKYEADLLDTKDATETSLDKKQITNNTDDADNIITYDNSDNIITDDNASISELIINDKIVGTGETPNIGDIVQIHYIGTLYDGTEFSNSYKENTPFSFEIGKGKVIRGWDNGISTMRRGGKRQLIVPPDLGYGSKGVGKTIPKNATLFFEIELIDINDELLIPPQNKKTVEIIKPSGLKMTIHKEGKGEPPKRGQKIVIHYAGELLDGTLFESSYDSRKPFIFTLGSEQVIPAFEEAFSEMKKGGVRTLQVPPHLGYGERVLEKIPEYSTLIYKVELIDFY